MKLKLKKMQLIHGINAEFADDHIKFSFRQDIDGMEVDMPYRVPRPGPWHSSKVVLWQSPSGAWRPVKVDDVRIRSSKIPWYIRWLA